MSRMRMGLPTPVPPPQVTAKKTDVTRQGCPSAGAPQARPSLETSVHSTLHVNPYRCHTTHFGGVSACLSSNCWRQEIT